MELKEKQVLADFIAYMKATHPETSMEHMLAIYPKGVIVDFVVHMHNAALDKAAECAKAKTKTFYSGKIEPYVDKQSILNLKIPNK